MESPTAFDLNLAIHRWRQELTNVPALNPPDLEELESHLRDSVDALTRGGLKADEAFLVACRRLGSAVGLEAEFGKVNTGRVWRHRALWMVAGVLVAGFFHTLLNGAATVVSTVCAAFAVRGHFLGAAGVAAEWLALALCLGISWRLARRGDGWDRLAAWGRRHAAGVVLVAVGLPLAGIALQMGTQVAAVKFLGPSDFGITMMWRSYSNLLISMMLWPGLLVWLLRRGARTQGTAMCPQASANLTGVVTSTDRGPRRGGNPT